MRKFRFATVVAATAAAVCLAAGAPSQARAQAITFEEFPAGTAIKAQYGPRGVIFPNTAFIATDPHPHSGTRVLRSISPTAEVFTAAPLVMTFPSPQKRVAFFAGNFPGGTGRGTLKAFGANNAVLAQDGPKAVPAGSFTASFQVKTPGNSIVRAEFQIENSALELIDDLEIGGAPVTPPSTAPAVAFTGPADNTVVNEGVVPLKGTVTGPSVLDTMTLRVVRGLPDGSTAPPSDNAVSLSGSGNARSFSLDFHALTGPYAVTAIATNTGNLQGTATVHFTVLPDAIRQRFDSSGGAAVFGALKFGSSDTGGCVIAVYEKGAIAAVGTQTFVVQGPIFQKWLAVKDPGSNLSRLGCPTAEETDSIAGSRMQDFRRGRIYKTATATAWTPAVFRDAIVALGDEAATGVPVTDPTDSSGAMQTWLFQRFARLDHPGIEASTLEIRGNPPVLFVERVGEGLETAGVDGFFPRTATVWRDFKCDGNLGPCHVEAPQFGSPITRRNADATCPGQYNGTTHGVEWKAITLDNYHAVPLRGWVHSSKLACTDNPLTHDYIMTNNNSACTITDVFPSDWKVQVKPLAPFGSLITEDQTYIELEWEAYYSGYFFAGWGWPIAGDLIFTSGRWAMDCGHHKPGFKAEIHPPFLTSHMFTQKREDGMLETVAEIWINGYFPGDPIDVDIWPPPRPTPDAFLTVTRPVDAGSALGLNVALNSSFSGARARFTAARREVEVEGSGKMNWATGRGYEAEWKVYWSLR